MVTRCLALTILLASSSLTGICDEPSVTATPELTRKVDELFAKWNRLDSPGCSVGIVQDGRLIYSKGIGTANLEYQVPNTPQTVFGVASFSKTLTCVCLALLMDEGRISPEDDLRKFIPEMHEFDPPIRIQDLVRCHSGLWDQVSIPILVGWENAPQQAPHTEADFFSLISGQKTLPFKPGAEFRYSSGDYFLLSIIIQRISGQPLAEFARQRIFEPLGMQRTFFEEDATRVVEQRAFGHHKPGRDGVWRLWRPTAYWAGGGGLMTCVEDLARWDQDFSNNRLPHGKYLNEILQEGCLLGNRYCLDVDAYFKQADPIANRDVPVSQYRGLRRRQFTGGAWGFSAAMTQFPDQKATFICLSNSDDIGAWTMNRRMADILLADQLQPQLENAAEPPLSEQPTVALDVVDLQDKVGAYRLKRTGQIWRIRLQDGNLKLTDHLLTTFALRPLSPQRFDPDGPFYPSTQLVFAKKSEKVQPPLVSQWNEPGNRGTLDFEAVEMVEPTAEQLAHYAGEYYCDELAATYRVALREDQLWLRINSRRWEQLDATVRDEFIPHVRAPVDGRIMHFVRDKEGKVTELSAEYYRVNGIRFVKR